MGMLPFIGTPTEDTNFLALTLRVDSPCITFEHFLRPIRDVVGNFTYHFIPNILQFLH